MFNPMIENLNLIIVNTLERLPECFMKETNVLCLDEESESNLPYHLGYSVH